MIIILKECGVILYRGQYPSSAIYLAYDTITKEYLWVSDSNDATVFPTMDYAKLIFTEYDSNIHNFRAVVIVDRPIN